VSLEISLAAKNPRRRRGHQAVFIAPRIGAQNIWFHPATNLKRALVGEVPLKRLRYADTVLRPPTSELQAPCWDFPNRPSGIALRESGQTVCG